MKLLNNICTNCRYLYCDEITLEADTVLSTLYVAKKYIVPHLCRACVLFLETSLTARNACLLLSQSRLFEEPELMARCWEVIDAQAQLALNSEGFTEIDMDTLKQILQRESLNCKEVIFHLNIPRACWLSHNIFRSPSSFKLLCNGQPPNVNAVV